jgi:TolB-like protein/class 3 adenylate cyclase/Tfp pilus assembly protein PilF
VTPVLPSPDAARSRILTLVFTDLQDSTGLKSAHGDRLAGDVIARHRAHLVHLAADAEGRIIDHAGDGCFLTFESSSAAVRFALRLQDVHHAEPDLPRVRVGVHVGEVTEAPGPLGVGGPPRVEGLAVDVAARIQALARPGQVLLSAPVASSARQRLEADAASRPVRWHPHGAYELKGLETPIEITEVGREGVARFAAPVAGEKGRPARSRESTRRRGLAAVLTLVVAAALLAYFASGRSGVAPGVPIRSLAVLPFDNLMNDPTQDYFADGMTEALISELAKIGSLKVISRTSVVQYADTAKTAPEIARELGVDGLIEGSVLRDGDQVRITAQLIHGPTDRHLWGESYTNTLTNVLRLHSDVALAIVAAVGATLTPEESRRIAGPGSVEPEAYEAFLLGLQLRDTATEKDLRTAVHYFERATQLDPDFARAWAELSRAHYFLQGWGIERPERAYPAARRTALRALELDPNLGAAHERLGDVAYASDWDWAEAERLYRKAVALAPSDGEARTSLAWMLLQTGRYAEAVAEAESALVLDPRSKLVRRDAATVLDYTGADPERAGRLLRELHAEDPDFIPALDALGTHQLAAGEAEAAIRTTEELIRASPREVYPRLKLASLHARAGEREKARELVDAARREFGDDGLVSDALSIVLVDLGEVDAAFRSFERSFEQRDWGMLWLRVWPYLPLNAASPGWTQLRSDPRYWDLMRRMDFPPFPSQHPGYADEQAQRAGLR